MGFWKKKTPYKSEEPQTITKKVEDSFTEEKQKIFPAQKIIKTTGFETPSQPAHLLRDRYRDSQTALSKGIALTGKLSFDRPVRIDGSLSGSIFSSHAVLIGNNADVDGEIDAQHVIIEGKVRGVISATVSVMITETGSVEGEINSKNLMLYPSGRLNGECSISNTL